MFILDLLSRLMWLKRQTQGRLSSHERESLDGMLADLREIAARQDSDTTQEVYY